MGYGITDFAGRVVGMNRVVLWPGPRAWYVARGVPRRGVRGACGGACAADASIGGVGAGVTESACNRQTEILPKRHAQA